MRETLINGQWKLILPDHRADRPEWVTGWEPERISSMCDLLTHEDVLYDIGTEEGDMSGLFSRWVDDIVIVEPNPRVWPNIRAIWEANDLKTPLGIFVGFAGRETRISQAWYDEHVQHDGWPECAYGPLIGDHGFLNITERPEVSMWSIDDIAQITGRPPTAITVDVEGSEWEVMRGAEQTLLNNRPLVWLSVHPEFMFFHYQEYEADLHKWMADRGYKKVHLAMDHEHHWLYVPEGS